MHRSRSRLIVAAIAVALAAPLVGSVAPAGAIPALDGCTAGISGSATAGVPASGITWYPANTGSQSRLQTACSFSNQTGPSIGVAPLHHSTSNVSASQSVHDHRHAAYHNGAGRWLHLDPIVCAAAPCVLPVDVATTPTTGMGAWVNHTISDGPIDPRDSDPMNNLNPANGICGLAGEIPIPFVAADTPRLDPYCGPFSANIAPRTTMMSAAAADITVNKATTIPAGGAWVIVENAPGARSFDDVVAGAAGDSTLTSAEANFQTADIGKSITGTGLAHGCIVATVPVPGGPVVTYIIAPAPTTGAGGNCGDPNPDGALGPVTIGGTMNGLVTGTIYGPTLVTSHRQVTDTTIDAAHTTITSPTNNGASVAAFGTTDIGLAVSVYCDQNTGGAVAPGTDDYPVVSSYETTFDTGAPAYSYITAVGGAPAGTTATVSPALEGAGAQTGCNLQIGEPSRTAPLDRSTVVNQGVQLNLAPAFVAGSQNCWNGVGPPPTNGDDHPEGFEVVGTWRNPGSFAGTGVSSYQPGRSPGSTASSRSLGQIVFENSASNYAAFVMERSAAWAYPAQTFAYPTAGGGGGLDRIGVAHYDIQTPFAPTSLAMCPNSATSAGLTYSMNLSAQTVDVATIPSGAGRPGTAQFRNILSLPTRGYAGAPASGALATVYVQSDAAAGGPLWWYSRLCGYPNPTSAPPGQPLANQANFFCGAG